MERECVKLVTELLTLPLETLGLRILEIENFAPVMNILGMHCALVLPTHRAQCAHPVTSLYRRNAACDLKLIAYVFRFAFWCAEFDTRKTVAVRIIEAIVKSGQVLDTIDSVDKLFTIIAPVLKDQVRVVHRAC